MVDTPSVILLLRLQALGSNTNLWGGYLNTALDTLERGSKGYQAYTVTGDATISQTNYSETNDYAVGFIKLNGTPTATWTHTLPARQNLFGAWNNSGYAGTLKASGGTGVPVPTGRRAWIYGDATDYYEASPNWLNSYASTLTNNGDIVVYATLSPYVAAAIAAASISNTGQVLVSGSDTTSGYFNSKVAVAGSFLTLSIANAGGNEVETFTFNEGGMALYSSLMAL